LLVGWLVGWLEFNVPFQHKFGYIRKEGKIVTIYGSRYVAIVTQPMHRLQIRPIVHKL